MSGLGKNDTAIRYVKLTKEGKFRLNKDETNTDYDYLEGRLADLYLRDEEYQGKKNRKLYIAIQGDDDVKYVLGISFDSRLMSMFINQIKSADLRQPIKIEPSVSKEKNNEGEDVETKKLFVKQNGTSLKWFYKKDGEHQVPAMKKVKINKKDVWVKDEYLDFYEDLILNDLRPQLVGATAKKSNVEIKSEKEDELPWEAQEVEDDLPFA